MDGTVSVSKGCFIFKPKDEGKKGKRKKHNDILDFSSEIWYRTYSTVWKSIEKKLSTVNKTISDVVLRDLESFISGCDTLCHPIQTAVLLMGVNLPDHGALFMSLASRLQNNLTPHIALLQSSDCVNVKTTIEQLVAQFLKRTKILDEEEMMELDYDSSDSDEDFANLKRSDCTLHQLVNWYNDKDNGKDLSPNPPKLVIILKDFEGFSSNVLEDTILILSQYSKRLPLVLVMGVATTTSALHRTLPHNVTSQLNIRLFQSKPSVYFLNNILDNVFLKADCPFQLGTRVIKFLTDVFLYYDFSVDGFIKGIKYCVMEHYFSSPTSVLCCSPKDLDGILDTLDTEHLNEFQKLPSVKGYLSKLSKQKQNKLDSSPATLKRLLKKLIEDLREYLFSFHLFVKLLHVLVSDLPNAPLGKQIREIYSEAVCVKISNNSGYNECFKILEFTAKDELLTKLNNMLKILGSSPNKSETVNDMEQKLAEFTKKIEIVGYESSHLTPTKSPSKEKFNVTSRSQFKEHLEKMSQSRKPKNAYEAARGDVLDYLKDEVFDRLFVPLTAVTFHEVILFENINSVKRHIIGSPRAAIHTALNNPHYYLQCDCCKSANDGEILPTMPDICIAYKLHLESGSLINMYDWLQSFATVIDPSNSQKNDEIDSQIQARFTQAVAELQFLGFIKSSKKKTDHVTRLTWGGSM